MDSRESDSISNQNPPDWSFPFHHGRFLMESLGRAGFSTVKAKTIGKGLKEFYEKFNENRPVTYREPNGTQSHSYIRYYGSKKGCARALADLRMRRAENERRNRENGLKSVPQSVPTIDLTGSPQPKKIKQEEEEDEEDPIVLEQSPPRTHHSRMNFVEIKRRDPVKNSYPKPKLMVIHELSAQFTSLISINRNSSSWRHRIRNARIEGVTPTQARNLKDLLIYGPLSVGKFIRRIAGELFTDERLMTTFLGENGRFLKAVGRSQIFSVEEEMRLINVLKLIDRNFFMNRDVQRLLVRDKVNAYGRELKKLKETKPKIIS